MPQVCRVCSHEDRAEIERLIGLGRGKRGIGKQFGISESSVNHHATVCVPESLALARSIQDMVRSNSLAAHLAQIYAKAQRIGEKAEKIGDEERSVSAYAVAMQGVREETRVSEFYVNTAAKIAEARSRQDDAATIRQILLEEACPSCRERIARRLLQIDEARRELEEGTNGAHQ